MKKCKICSSEDFRAIKEKDPGLNFLIRKLVCAKCGHIYNLTYDEDFLSWNSLYKPEIPIKKVNDPQEEDYDYNDYNDDDVSH